MYLINIRTFKLECFIGECPLPYAILSHTWDVDEVTFADFSRNRKEKYEKKKGYDKLQYTCKQAKNDNIQYVWIDTCCINKDSSAELSEAINSMYKWYEKAAVCYAYLADFQSHDSSQIDAIASCRWFNRGWTLQELLAPKRVVFYGENWTRIGTKSTMIDKLQEITGVPTDILLGQRTLDTVSVAARMSWAATRETTRIEDTAYCLLGIFDVNMPLLYGEGEKAFLRLQGEIMNQNQDDSLFAWCADTQSGRLVPYRGLYAKSPKEFAACGDIETFGVDNNGATTFFGNGRISLNCGLDHRFGKFLPLEQRFGKALAGIKCYRKSILHPLAIEVTRIGTKTYLRSNPCSLFPVLMRPFDQHIIMERYAERSRIVAIPDVHQLGSIYLGHIPSQFILRSLLPSGLRNSTEGRISALDAMEAKKVAFHMSISPSYLERLQPMKSQGLCDILLVFCVNQRSGNPPYRYSFEVIPVYPLADLASRTGEAPDWQSRMNDALVKSFFEDARKPKSLSGFSITAGGLEVHFNPSQRVIEGHEVMYIDIKTTVGVKQVETPIVQIKFI